MRKSLPVPLAIWDLTSFAARPIEGVEIAVQSPHEAIQAGIGLAPEDRKAEGLVLAMNVQANVSLASLDEVQQFELLSNRLESALANRFVNRLDIRTPSTGQTVRNLSGGNERAARLSGLRVDRIKLAVYSLAGLLAAVAGLIQASRIDSAQPNAGLGYELDSIAAVVIGGSSLSGGRGSILGTVIGCLIIGVLNNGLAVLGVSDNWQLVIKGVVILLAVAIDKMNGRNERD